MYIAKHLPRFALLVVMFWMQALLVRAAPQVQSPKSRSRATRSSALSSSSSGPAKPKTTRTRTPTILTPSSPEFLEQQSCFSASLAWHSSSISRHDIEFSYRVKTFQGPPLINTYTTKVRVDPGFSYTDCEGFTRYEFFSKSGPQNFTLSTFNVTITTWRTRHRSKQVTTLTEEPLKWPNCWLEDYCDYLFRSLITRRLTEPTLTAPFENDKDNPRHQCHRATQCALDIRRDLVLIHWRTSSQDRGSSRCFNTRARFVSTTTSYALSRTFSTDAITFRGLELWLEGVIEEPGTTSSVLRTNFTFTYPTVYIAHHPIVSSYLSGRRNRPHRTIIPAGIVPVNATDIYTSSLNIPDATEWARRIGRGERIQGPRNLNPPGALKRLNFSDLQEPAPATAYYSHNRACWFGGAHCATLTHGNFRPTLYLHDRVFYSLLQWDVLGHDWKPDDCALPNVWDPDIELEPVSGEPQADPGRKRRFVTLHTNVLASATAVDSFSQGQITKDPAMTIATQTAYHVSATSTFIP